MTILFASLLPLLGLPFIYAMRLWPLADKRTAIYLGAIPIIGLFSWGIESTGIYFKSYFSEVWNYKITAVRYYEPWNERVSCRHPKYETRTKRDGTTETVFVGYEHSYDVDYHPSHWEAKDEYGNEHGISQSTYGYWRNYWKNVYFVDMHRRYHTIDGDMHQSNWTGGFEKIYPWSEIKNYENKVRVCTSVFAYAEVTEEIKTKFPRPADTNNTNVIHSFGISIKGEDELLLKRHNAEMGRQYEVHSLVYLFNSKEYNQSVVEDLKNAWQGPNMNELVTCIGLDVNLNVMWCDVVSWMDDTKIHASIREDVFRKGKYNAEDLRQILRKNITNYWKRKSFDKDFDYLQVDTPSWCIIFNIILSISISVGGIVGIIKQG